MLSSFAVPEWGSPSFFFFNLHLEYVLVTLLDIVNLFYHWLSDLQVQS